MADRNSGGSHWTLLFQNLYFDSFGCPPTLAVSPFASVWNDTQYQDFHSSACGFYCIFVADNLLAGRPPTLGLIPDDLETPTHSSEHVLRNHFIKNNDRFSAGAGFFDSLIKRFKPRKAESARLRTFLDTKGSQDISSIEIARKPVHGIITKALDLASGGRFSKKKRELGYTDIMHNYLLVTLKDGSTYRVEKNHQIETKKATSSDLQGERSHVPLISNGNPTSLTLKDMVSKASENDPKFWNYDAQNANCQDFTKSMLEKNGLTPEHNPAQQNAVELINTLPLGGTIPKLITDTAAYADQVVFGGSVALDRWY